MSGLVAGLYVTRVIAMVTDQHGCSDSFILRASGSHEKGDSLSKQERSMSMPLLGRICHGASLHVTSISGSATLSLRRPKVFREYMELLSECSLQF